MDYSKDRPTMNFFETFRLHAFTKPRLDVYWEPTPHDVASEILRLADVRQSDLVYDLGCGDGRILIMAAKKAGARCVGVDLDPQRITESSANAVQEGVTELVSFINEDLFKTDISRASVLILFLFPDVNLRLRPKLLSEMKPGARVVSYCHHMEAWKPDCEEKARRNHMYRWVVPANFSGRWEGRMDAGVGSTPIRLEVRQEFQRLSGWITFEGRRLTLDEGIVRGDFLTLTTPLIFNGLSPGSSRGLPLNGLIRDPSPKELIGEAPVEIKAVIEGDTMNGTMTTPASRKSLTWTAMREPSTLVPLAR